MTPASLQFGYAVTRTIFEKSVDGISNEESRQCPPLGGNSINWMVGHLLWARRGPAMQSLLGLAPASDGLDLEVYRISGPTLAAGDSSGVAFDKLVAAMAASSDQIAAGLAKLTGADLERDIDPKSFPFPPEHPTLGNFLTLVLIHESYHIGQIGLGRRMLGKPSGLGA